jgi:hypothetical protein
MQGKRIYRFIAYPLRAGGYYIAIEEVADNKVVADKQRAEVPQELVSKAAAKSNAGTEKESAELDDHKGSSKLRKMQGGENNVGVARLTGAQPPDQEGLAKLGQMPADMTAETETKSYKPKQPARKTQPIPSHGVPAAGKVTVTFHGVGPAPEREVPVENLALEQEGKGEAATMKRPMNAKTFPQDHIKHEIERGSTTRIAKHEPSIGSMLAGGDPIAMFSEPTAEDIDPGRPTQTMGNLILMESTQPSSPISIKETLQSDIFEIIYMRPDAPLREGSSTELAGDDIAMILRAFMLARISVARLEMRDTLQQLARRRQEAAALARPPAGRLDSCAMLARLQDEGHGASHGDKDGFAFRLLAALEGIVAQGTASLRKAMQENKVSVLLLGVLLFAWVLGWVWIPYLGDYRYEARGVEVLLLLLGGGAVFFLFNALNLKSVEQRLEETMHEQAVDKLNAILASLVQSNANVAALNLTMPLPGRVGSGLPPESLMDQMDCALKVKERFKSISSVIKARQAHVVDGAKHIEEHRDRVRRSIAAAGSGVFVGFFTYEVGESVMRFLHVIHQQDPSAMLYWLFANSDRIRVVAQPAPSVHALTSNLAAPTAGANEGVIAPVAALADSSHFQRGPVETHTVAHGPTLDAHFVTSYHKPELLAHSWLLTITITVSVLTAWIAMRKPAAEQSGGHGHH